MGGEHEQRQKQQIMLYVGENAPLLSSESCLALIQSSDHMILFASVSLAEWGLLGMQLVIVQ